VVLSVEFDEEHSAVRCVASEDVRIARRISVLSSDDRLKTSLLNGPNRVLAGRTAPKISADQQDACSSSFGLIQRKLRTANVTKKKFPEANLADPRKEASRNDSVGIDVILVVDRKTPLVCGEAFHTFSLSQVHNPWSDA
jgi:hypothetical protein